MSNPQIETTYIEVKGIPHYCEWIRTPSLTEQSKPIIVFLHGWGGSGRYWRSTATALASDFDCLIYDLRGFGRSTFRNASSNLPQKDAGKFSYEMSDYAADLAALLDTLNLDKIYLKAHSMGASIAAAFLNLYPQRVHRAILTCTGIFEYDEKAFKTFHTFSRYVVLFRPKWLLLIPGMDQLFMARFLHRPLPRQLSQEFLEDFLLADYEAAYQTVLTSVSQAATQWLPEQFKNFSVKTLLISGEKDIIIPAKMGLEAAKLNQNLEFSLMANTAHFPMLEDPVTYLETVQNFLKKPATLTSLSSQVVGS